jgi:hypothetical protein
LQSCYAQACNIIGCKRHNRDQACLNFNKILFQFVRERWTLCVGVTEWLTTIPVFSSLPFAATTTAWTCSTRESATKQQAPWDSTVTIKIKLHQCRGRVGWCVRPRDPGSNLSIDKFFSNSVCGH